MSQIAKHGDKGEPGYRNKHPGYRTGYDANGPRSHAGSMGNSTDRTERKKLLLFQFGNGNTCPCLWCGTKLNFDTITQDRLYEGKKGGGYTAGNLVPACMSCNSSRQDKGLEPGSTWRPKAGKKTARQTLADAQRKGLLSTDSIKEAEALKRTWNKAAKERMKFKSVKDIAGRYYQDKQGKMRRRSSNEFEPGEVVGPGFQVEGRRGNRTIKKAHSVPPEFSLVVATTEYITPGIDETVIGPLTYRTSRTGEQFYTVLVKDPHSKPGDPDYFEVEVQPLSISDIGGALGIMKRFVSDKERDKLAEQRKALPDKSFPIANEADLRNAIKAYGRAKDKPKAKAHIKRRAHELGCPELLPDNWDGVEKAEEDFTLEVPIAKVDEDQQLVFGWAQIVNKADGSTVNDRQGDFIADIADLETVAYDYVLTSRDGGEMHVRKGVMTLVESMVFTTEKIEKLGLPEGSMPTGWWTGYKVSDPEVWADVKSGKYKMFSVHGTGLRIPVEAVA